MKKSSQKFSIALSAPARRVLGEVALRWGGVSRVAAVELMLRRIGHLEPFEKDEPWFMPAKGEFPVVPEPVEAEEPDPRQKPLFTELEDAAPEANAEPTWDDHRELLLAMANAAPEPDPLVAPVVEAPPAEPEPAPEPAARAPREFVRAWYDDGAPVWVQLLGADATNGLDLTAEQREALNEWQAGVDREAP